MGKSFLARAHSACRADHSVRFYRLQRLVDELTRDHALQNRASLPRQIANAELLVIDDFGLTPLSDQGKRDLLEIIDDDRYDRSSTIVTSRLPVD